MIEEQMSHFKNDVWELAQKEDESTNANDASSLSKILSHEKSKLEYDQRKQRREKYREQLEAQFCFLFLLILTNDNRYLTKGMLGLQSNHNQTFDRNQQKIIKKHHKRTDFQ